MCEAQSAATKSALKQPRSASYKKKDVPTYGNLFKTIAGRNGLTPAVAPELASKPLDYEAEEDGAEFLKRCCAGRDRREGCSETRLMS